MMLRKLVLSCLLCSLIMGPAAPQPAAPTQSGVPLNYTSLWVGKEVKTRPEAVRDAVDEVAQKNSDPDQIIVLIHGFKKPREGSTRDFNALADDILEHYEKGPSSVAVVGVQWDSSVAVPSSSGLDALRMLRAYHDTIPVARDVGRGPARALLLALQDRFPEAHLSVFAHSMGCEVAAAALLPEIRYEEYPPTQSPVRPNDVVGLDMLVLAGSDLDYDFWYKSGLTPRQMEGRAKLTWITVADYFTKGDKVLNTRKRIRGRAAGSSFPRMGLAQLDQAVAEQRLFIDRQEIPRSHQFLDYYQEHRIERLLDTLRYLTIARAPQPDEMAELDEILAAPNDLETLLPYLDHPSYAAKFYALWRIERLHCGDARHMTDLTLDEVLEALRHNPQQIPAMRAQTECVTFKKGLFPTKLALKKAGVVEP